MVLIVISANLFPSLRIADHVRLNDRLVEDQKHIVKYPHNILIANTALLLPEITRIPSTSSIPSAGMPSHMSRQHRNL